MYFEMMTILTMYEKEIPNQYGSLLNWYSDLKQVPCIQRIDQEFMQVVTQWNLYYNERPSPQ